MENRNCLNKDKCWDYNESRCESCALGEKIARRVRQNKKLKAENAELRAKLDKAVELPCKIGDTVYEVHDKCDGRNCPFNGYYGQWRCHYEGKKRCKPFISTEKFWYNHIPRINKTIFVPKEAAEAKLKEKEDGEKDNG